MNYLSHVIWGLPTLIRTRSLAYADEKWVESTKREWTWKEFRVLGTNVTLPPDRFGLAREIYGRKVYFVRPGFDLRRGNFVVDLGAQGGVFSILAAKLGCTVVAIEGQSGFIKELKASYQINLSDAAIGNVIPVFGIIGHETGFFSDTKRLKASSHYQDPPPALTMKGLISQHHIQHIDFLKIDIEGSEYSLFSGDLSWLSLVDKIAMEVHTEFGDPIAISRTLKHHGFQVELVSNDGRVVDAITPPAGYLFARI